MKLTELWVQETAKSLQMIYGGRLKPAQLQAFLESKVRQVEPEKYVLKLRNVYEGTLSEIPADEILNVVESDNLIIGANGAYCLNHTVNMSPISKDLIRMKSVRKRAKDEQFAAKRSGDHDLANFKENEQTHVKQSTNAYYGVQLQPGSFLYNPDTASLITIQARELISEMMWTLERLLEGNPQFFSIGECVTFIKRTLEMDFKHDWDDVVTYEPTDKEFRTHMLQMYNSVPKARDTLKKSSRSFYIFLKSLTPEQKKRIYYANNLEALLGKNPKVLQLIIDTINDPTPFVTPTKVHENIKPRLDALVAIVLNFVYAPIGNYQRIHKYLHRYRKSVVLSDTDSVMVHLGSWVERFVKMSKMTFDTFDDETETFKVVNTFAYMCTVITRVACENFCVRCRIPENYRNLIEMKNEFLFKRLVNYAASKKSYAGHQRLREGDQIDEIEWKGLKLVGSGVSPRVMKLIRTFVDENILKSKVINPLLILSKVRFIENTIKSGLREGDITLGKSTRFSGDEYKDVFTNAGGRSCLSWNVLYPDDAINEGDYGYMFDCNLIHEADCEKIKSVDPEMYTLIKEKIFHNPEYPQLAKYGIPYISIPKEGVFKEIPEWIKVIMDVDGMCNKHMQPIAALLPSIGLYRSRISSTRHVHSSLIQF